MASLSNRQAILRPTSNRAALVQLGQAQQPLPGLLSGRALVGHIGLGRLRPVAVDVLTPREIGLPAPLPDFHQVKATLDQRQAQAASRPRTPKEAGYSISVLSPAEQAQRRQAQQRLAVRAKQSYQQLLHPLHFTSWAEPLPQQPLFQRAKSLPAGPDSFMPKRFWHTHAPS